MPRTLRVLVRLQRVNATDILPIGSRAYATAVSSASTSSGGTTEPAMTISPAESLSPNAASRSATWRTMSTSFPVAASGSVVLAASTSRRNTRAVRPVVLAASARPIGLAHDHVALEDIALEDRFRVLERQVGVGELDCRRECGDSGRRSGAIAAACQVAADADRNLRLRHRLDPALERSAAAGGNQPTLHQEADKRCRDLEFLHRRGCAEADLPAERPLAGLDPRAPCRELRLHPACDARIVPSCCGHVTSPPPAPRSPDASIEPAPIQPHTSTTSSFDVLLKPCQQPRGE